MQLIRNAIQTPDGTILESFTRHDYKTYTDANGKEYMVDGGLSYLRRSAHGDELDLSISSDSHLAQREWLRWGSYGKRGDEPLTYKRICDMSDDHIQAVLKNVPNISPVLKACMVTELEMRNG